MAEPWKWPFYSGLWCLSQSAVSAFFGRQYALHEAMMGAAAITAAAATALLLHVYRSATLRRFIDGVSG